MREIYIFGHKKPDTDSVTSAIALSYLKNQMGINTKPMILGYINKETEFVLDYFDVETPEYLEDVKLQIKDVNYHKNCYINEYESIDKAYSYMNSKNITGVPIVNKNNKFLGLITTKMIGVEFINSNFTTIHTSLDNILETLKADLVLKFDEEITGNVVIPNETSNVITENSIIIIGDWCNIKDYVNTKVKLLILVGNKHISEDEKNIASQNRINIIHTHYDLFRTIKLINLSNYIGNLLYKSRNIVFSENEYYDDFKKQSLKLGYNNYPVVDERGKCLGLIRVTDIDNIEKKQVILVDHNDISQSVDGLNEADILEIIDHHNLGSITTNMPINFRNMIVGSTNTIIYSLYNESGIDIPSNIAGLMLSGIISDTIKFTSPTTTEYDVYVANKLAKKIELDIDDYASKMFKAGTDLKGKSIEEIVQGDIKTYEINDKKVAISQVLTLAADEILNKKEEYINYLNSMNSLGYDIVLLSVTDILKDGSYLFFNNSSEKTIADMFGFETISEGYFFEKCLSRKKQILPLLMDSVK